MNFVIRLQESNLFVGYREHSNLCRCHK